MRLLFLVVTSFLINESAYTATNIVPQGADRDSLTTFGVNEAVWCADIFASDFRE